MTAPRPSQNRMDRSRRGRVHLRVVQLGQGVALQGRAPARRLELGAPVLGRDRPRFEAALAVGPVQLHRHPISSSTRVSRVASVPSSHSSISWVRETSLENRAPTDSPRWMRLMASPMSGATDRVVILRDALALGQRDRVGQDDLAQRRGRDPIDGRVAQDAVGGAGVDLGDALALEGPDDLDERAGRVDLVIDDDRPLALDVADDVHELGPVQVADAALLDDGERRVQQLGEGPGALGEAEVRHDHRVLDLLVAEVVREHVDRGQLVDRDVEEALDLALVEVHREDPVRAGDRDHVGDEAGRDRDARLVLLVGAAVRVERDDGRDPARRWPA